MKRTEVDTKKCSSLFKEGEEKIILFSNFTFEDIFGYE